MLPILAKVVLEGEFEKIIEKDGHYLIESKKDRICVLPYTISDNGLLDKIGVVKQWNTEEEKATYTLLYDYLNVDDETNLTGANRVLFQILGVNFDSAENWMFLGSLFNTTTSESPIKIYAVDITVLGIDKINISTTENKQFKLIDSSSVLQTDDVLFLASFSRLFNYFYIKSLK
jgi:hypothetical protein